MKAEMDAEDGKQEKKMNGRNCNGVYYEVKGSESKAIKIMGLSAHLERARERETEKGTEGP